MAAEAIGRLGPLEGDVVMACHEIPTRTVAEALRVGRAAGATTILNPAPAAGLDAATVALADVLTPNRSELTMLAATVLGEEAAREAATDPVGVAGRLLAALPSARRRPSSDARRVRRADRPARGRRGGRRPPSPIDSTGAGDAFSGALPRRSPSGVRSRMLPSGGAGAWPRPRSAREGCRTRQIPRLPRPGRATRLRRSPPGLDPIGGRRSPRSDRRPRRQRPAPRVLRERAPTTRSRSADSRRIGGPSDGPPRPTRSLAQRSRPPRPPTPSSSGPPGHLEPPSGPTHHAARPSAARAPYRSGARGRARCGPRPTPRPDRRPSRRRDRHRPRPVRGSRKVMGHRSVRRGPAA
jgi:hypothetical protein